jgi:CheY-like chemotaxis protein
MEAPKNRATDEHIPGRRVLVVDDCADTVRMMKLLLKQEGFEVRTACDGPEALESAKCHRPDIVLLDLTLPTIGGVEVAEELRSYEGLHDTFIVAVSGRDGVPAASPFDRHLPKPIDYDRLIKLLAEAASKAEQRQARVPVESPAGLET